MTRYIIALTLGAALSAGVAAVAAFANVLGDVATGTDVGGVATGTGAIAIASIFGILVRAFIRGDIAVRDTAANEAALRKVAEDRANEITQLNQAITSVAGLTRDAIDANSDTRLVLAEATRVLEETRRELARHRPPGTPP